MLLPERFVSDAELSRSSAELLRRGVLARVWNREPPIPVELLIEHVLETRIEWRAAESPDAEIVAGWTDPDESVIYLNEVKKPLFESTPGLERYTLGHEAGHRVLHVDPASRLQLRLDLVDEDETILCRSGDTTRREIQAERFAAFLLMPPDLMRLHAVALETSEWRNVYKLRDVFQVSVTAMMNRLRELSYATPLTPQPSTLL
jgi:Zn-dependent peptidase ImmA (M78 family)